MASSNAYQSHSTFTYKISPRNCDVEMFSFNSATRAEYAIVFTAPLARYKFTELGYRSRWCWYSGRAASDGWNPKRTPRSILWHFTYFVPRNLNHHADHCVFSFGLDLLLKITRVHWSRNQKFTPWYVIF